MICRLYKILFSVKSLHNTIQQAYRPSAKQSGRDAKQRIWMRIFAIDGDDKCQLIVVQSAAGQFLYRVGARRSAANKNVAAATSSMRRDHPTSTHTLCFRHGPSHTPDCSIEFTLMH